MKIGSTVIVKGEAQKMTVKSIERGIVVCEWLQGMALGAWITKSGQFYYHNLMEVKP